MEENFDKLMALIEEFERKFNVTGKIENSTYVIMLPPKGKKIQLVRTELSKNKELENYVILWPDSKGKLIFSFNIFTFS